MTETQLTFLWQPVKDGARLLRVYGNSSQVELPDKIEQKTSQGVESLNITELGSYCFAKRTPRFRGDACLGDQIVNGSSYQEQEYSAVCGDYVERVRLPEHLHTIDNAAFYNCEALRELSIGTEIKSIGGDVFTNDDKLKRLIVRCKDGTKSGLPLVLERYKQDITVQFIPDGASVIDSSIYFPEYYEMLDEIAPAHIFSRSVEGEGYRMRNCFRDGMLNYEEYDKCYDKTMAEESDENLCRIAENRLRWPVHLKDFYREQYRKALEKRMKIALRISVRERDLETLQYLCEAFKIDTMLLDQAMDQAIGQEWAEGASFFMEVKSKASKEESFDFDLDF